MISGQPRLLGQFTAGTGQGIFRRVQFTGRDLAKGPPCPHPVLMDKVDTILFVQGDDTGPAGMTDDLPAGLTTVRQPDPLHLHGEDPANEAGVNLEQLLMEDGFRQAAGLS